MGDIQDHHSSLSIVESPRNVEPESHPTLNTTTRKDELSAQETPLPKLQLFLLLYIQLAEPITSTVIYPFVNQLVRGTGVTGGDERKTGYFAGIIESAFYAVEAICTLQWGRLSDRIGRKPVFLGGLLGLTLSMLGFGMARQYWALILARCAEGALNGNMGVAKSMMTEITDSTNRARGFAFLPMIWSVGATVGPVIGGVFSRPADRWSAFEKSRFWDTYQYFLPCIVAACFSISAFTLTLVFLTETLGRTTHLKVPDIPLALASDTKFQEQSITIPVPYSATGETTGGATTRELLGPGPRESSAQPVGSATLRSVLVPRVLWPVLNYMFFAFADQCVVVLVPLMYSTSIPLGGLNFSSLEIGLIQGVAGCLGGVIQVFTFPYMLRKAGIKWLYTLSYGMFFAVFALFPFISYVTKREGHAGSVTWVLVVVQFVFYISTFMGWGCIFMYVSDGAPNKQSLGMTNGIAQTSASFVRAVAPSASSSLYSVSLQQNIASGTLVFWLLCALTIGGLVATRHLPKRLLANDRRPDIV